MRLQLKQRIYEFTRSREVDAQMKCTTMMRCLQRKTTTLFFFILQTVVVTRGRFTIEEGADSNFTSWNPGIQADSCSTKLRFPAVRYCFFVFDWLFLRLTGVLDRQPIKHQSNRNSGAGPVLEYKI